MKMNLRATFYVFILSGMAMVPLLFIYSGYLIFAIIVAICSFWVVLCLLSKTGKIHFIDPEGDVLISNIGSNSRISFSLKHKRGNLIGYRLAGIFIYAVHDGEDVAISVKKELNRKLW